VREGRGGLLIDVYERVLAEREGFALCGIGGSLSQAPDVTESGKRHLASNRGSTGTSPGSRVFEVPVEDAGAHYG
jgi:hypothetical protein